MKRSWFGPKLVGWGASPASWEGWAVTGVFILAIVVTVHLFRESAWVWAPILAEAAAYLVVALMTYDKNARTWI